MLVFGENVTHFFRIKIFMKEGSPKKCIFHRTPLLGGVGNYTKLTFSRSDILKTTMVTPAPLLLHFLIEGVKIYNIGKYK